MFPMLFQYWPLVWKDTLYRIGSFSNLYSHNRRLICDNRFRKLSYQCLNFKGVVASYRATLSEEYTPLEGVKPVLTWFKGCPGHNQIISEDQMHRRYHNV